MNISLKGKKAFISGSSKGIGFGIAKTLKNAGCDVLINGRSQKDLEKASSNLDNCFYVAADMTNRDELIVVREKIEEVFNGQLDIIVCNVGSGRSVPAGEETYDEWQRVFHMNFWSATNTIEGLKDLLLDKGAIVCTSSICGHEIIPGAPITYSVAKSALNTYVKAISRPLGEQGIRINAVEPGNILFKGSVWEKKCLENKDTVDRMLEENVALKSLGEVEDIANIVLFLASGKSSFVTGSVWTADGGQVRS